MTHVMQVALHRFLGNGNRAQIALVCVMMRQVYSNTFESVNLQVTFVQGRMTIEANSKVNG